MAAVMLLLEQRLRETLVRESIDKGLAAARGLAFNVEDPLLTGDDLALFSAAKNAVRAPGVVVAVILDRTGTIRADTAMERVGTRYQQPGDSQPVQEAAGYRVLRVRPPDGGSVLDLAVPIVTVAEPPLEIGTIHLGLSEAKIGDDIRQMRLHLAGLALLALLLGTAGAALLAGLMVGPLAALVRGVRAIGDGHLDQRIELQRNDELGVLTDAFNDMAASLRDKEFIKSTFERYVSKQLAEQILQRRDQLRLGGELRDVTVLFSDIRRFTTLAERLSPEQVVDLLNGYFTRMIQVVSRHEGMVDKLMGDSVMALFGAPISLGDDPLRAVCCALEMQSEGAAFSRECEARGLPPLPMGIGINTGPVIAGNIGSTARMEYTVIGDEVNIAARLQGIAGPGEVLVSGRTYAAVAHAVRVTPLEPMQLKGKQAKVDVYRVDGLRENE
jgi:class 3 adenylate cyclase